MKRVIKYCFIAGVVLSALLISCDQTRGVKKENRAATSTEIDKVFADMVDTSSTVISSEAGDNILPVKLVGRWLRSDGDYVIEIFSFNPDGKANVGYFNPNPINVEKGEWEYNGGRLLISVVLRDVNYPGSKYSLSYNPENDTFTGTYYQAVEGFNYDVMFIRKK